MKYVAFIILLMVLLSACRKDPVPKPRGYFRIDLPEKKYLQYEASCPVKFELPTYSKIELYEEHNSNDSCWFNISIPKFHAKIHCTYMPVSDNFSELLRESYEVAFKHEMKASAIERTPFQHEEQHVYGMIYDLKGEVASQVQFFATDSVKHFFRGSLYFDHKPNPDSLAPVLNFIRQDIVRIAETVEWR